MVEVPGLPAGVPILHPTIREMVEMGRWDLKAEEEKGEYIQPGTHFEVKIQPRPVPGVKQFKTGFRGRDDTAVDTRIAHVERNAELDMEFYRPALNPESGYVDKIPAKADGNLFRGLSWEEFQFIRQQCKVVSNCSYNLGECQMGRTFFSEDPETAAHYGGTFQPYHLQPTFERPGYVIKVRRPPPEKIDAAVSSGTNEIAVIGELPASDILAVYEIRPYAIEPGFVELRIEYGREKGFHEGSRRSPDVWVAYRKLEDIGDLCSRMERTRMVEEQRAEEVKNEDQERFKLVGKRIPAEMRDTIRELGKEMPIDFVEVETPGEGGPELTIETKCGATKLDGLADKVKLSESLSMVSCKTLGQKKEVPS